jgi:hypothetical protein
MERYAFSEKPDFKKPSFLFVVLFFFVIYCRHREILATVRVRARAAVRHFDLSEPPEDAHYRLKVFAAHKLIATGMAVD